MWDDDDGADFQVDDLDQDLNTAATEAQERLRREAETFGLWNPVLAARETGFGDAESGEILRDMLGEDPEGNDILDELLRNAARMHDEHHDEMNNDPSHESGNPEDHSRSWFPYESKVMFLLDMIDNLPRLRISSSLMRVLLWVLKEMGVRHVPSLDRLRKVQKDLRQSSGVESIDCVSVRGNRFTLNDPVALDYANPLTVPLLERYPVKPDGKISEVYHAQKWHQDVPLDALSPMYDDRKGHQHFYVNELAQMRDGSFVIPFRWLHSDYSNAICDSHYVFMANQDGIADIVDETKLFVAAHDLASNYLALKDRGHLPLGCSSRSLDHGYPTEMPNPLRLVAKGRPLYTSFVDYFGDDVSANRSKAWNKHWNGYITHRNLPRRIIQQEFHIHFVSTSPNAGIAEQFCAAKKQIQATHTEPVVVFDAATEDEAALRLYVNAETSDNPMSSEVASHIGGQGNYLCRKCDTGGTDKDKESDEGFEKLFTSGNLRSKEAIIKELTHQIFEACSGVAKRVSTAQTDSGVKDAYTQYFIEKLIAEARTLRDDNPEMTISEAQKFLWAKYSGELNEMLSPFLSMEGFDPSQDTPVELLHTILLGIVKYIWHATHTKWNAAQKRTYALRLQATNRDGLSIHPIRANYIMQYANSLIGRQLKTVIQTAVFHVHDLVDPLPFRLWKAVGDLAVLLWFTEISEPNLEQYLADIEVAVANVLDLFAGMDASQLLEKIKLHLLNHICQDTRRFGPLLNVITESYECFNAVFRACSILSNHLAPSRDIANQLADLEGFKHRLTGGWWADDSTGTWVRAGSDVRDFMQTCPMLQTMLGWSDPAHLKPASVRLVPNSHSRPAVDLLALASHALNIAEFKPLAGWLKCASAVSQSLDECFDGSWIYADSSIANGSPMTGRITAILTRSVDSRNSDVIAIIDVYHVSAHRHDIYDMPVLTRRHGEDECLIIPVKNLKFKYNVQHDCVSGRCSATGARPRMQERQETTITEEYIEHDPIDRWIINTLSFHNAHLIREMLPRSLWAPTPLHNSEDRQAKHDEYAAEMREKRNGKRAVQKEKADAKRAANANVDHGAVPVDGVGGRKRKRQTGS
ncbi:uncharacterized protein B0H18DRAFT_939590 [Fomitopsis serialis]|uniref:uncharacterized protein n=1 Tax=Fomitopsis serialis TaxID=139415 RepID=UPI00200897FF|nr:uncharacterized protein B0H18DRAFT_939590 [Neoantrodia serialis]KAH9915819.1 hypothetical protein B0H18DRAFT_939590 [Neoantrodia serialis]